MDSKQKAEYLINRFSGSKSNALICVDEIIKDISESLTLEVPHCRGLLNGSLAFWLEVQREMLLMELN